MKDRIEIAVVLRTDEFSGKGTKALAAIAKNVISKIEPQLIRVAEALTKYAEEELNNNKSNKN